MGSWTNELIYFYIIGSLSTVIHECGHYFALKNAKVPIMEVVIGEPKSKLKLSLEIRGIKYTIYYLLPFIGRVGIDIDNAPLVSRFKYGLCFAAGMLLNSAIAAIGYVLHVYYPLIAIFKDIAIINLIYLFFALLGADGQGVYQAVFKKACK